MEELVKKKLSSLSKNELKKIILSFSQKYPSFKRELNRLSNYPRHQETFVKFLGRKIKINDSAAFLSMYNETFVLEVNKFYSNKLKYTLYV